MIELLEELAAVGYPVDSVSALRSSGVRYSKAVPVLIKWLPLATEPKYLQEDIVRALSVPWARQALSPLIQAFTAIGAGHSGAQASLHWAIGNALEVLWDDEYFEELARIASNPNYGKAREMVVLGLARSKRPEAGDLLVRLLGDPVVNGHATKALSSLRVPHAREALAQMVYDDRAWVRRAATKALRNIGGDEAR